MGYQKLQVGRITAMDDKKSDVSDTVNLNDPIKTYALTAFGYDGTNSILTDSAATFISDGVQPGDVAYNVSTAFAGGRVLAINSETQIVVAGVIASAAGTQFTILKGSNEPAVLYVGTTPSTNVKIKVRTSGGDDITLHNPPEGSFLPVQVKRVFLTGTTATDVLALF